MCRIKITNKQKQQAYVAVRSCELQVTVNSRAEMNFF